MHKRVAILFFMLMVIFGMLTVNLSYILIQNTEVSETVGTKSETVNISRGGIYDRNLIPLVNTDKSYICYALPSTEALKKLEPYMSDSEMSDIYSKMSNGKIIKLNCTHIFNENEIVSVGVVKRYNGENLCPHLIGYLDGDGNGVAGLEKNYDSFLKMTGGTVRATWSADAQNRILLGQKINVTETNYPDAGGISLTIDKEFQSALQKIMNNSDISVGAAVIMDSENSEILASCSLPSFDPQNVAAYLNKENAPLINRADTAYSVGSVFKPFVAAAALENGIEVEHYCNGIISVGGKSFRCNNGIAHGQTEMAQAMEKSCNTYFIHLGQSVGAEKLLNICEGLGLGKSFEYEDGIYSKKGNLPSLSELSSQSALANLSFGQGTLLATPWQMAAAYSAIANGGVYHTPVLMNAILGENQEVIQRLVPDEGVRVISKDTAGRLDKILRGVVENGTAKLGFTEKARGCGKTATAQSGWIKDGREILHTWFCGYFTYNEKTYTVVILKEDGTSGANDCAPIFKTVTETICEIIDGRK
ncbi:MAG: penicillin-binding protein 2 [Oscillospiraceae bacterium]|nr:penicillin-binding protein 2 [Oscillospiraceae bacterium]